MTNKLQTSKATLQQLRLPAATSPQKKQIELLVGVSVWFFFNALLYVHGQNLRCKAKSSQDHCHLDEWGKNLFSH